MTKTKPTTQEARALRKWNKATKLWQLLAIAVADAKRLTRTGKASIDMFGWLWFHKRTRKCYACLAGSVMYCTLGSRQRSGKDDPSDFDPPTCAKLYAIDHLRTGLVTAALYELGLDNDPGVPLNRQVTDHADDPVAFWKDMRKLLADLRKADL